MKDDIKSVLSIRWFGPKFSPKDVPRFYDVASITEVYMLSGCRAPDIYDGAIRVKQ